MRELTFKWISLPYSIFIILMGGSAINLTMRFGEKSNIASEGMQLFMLLCTNFGYFMGLISGALADKVKPAKWLFLISGILSFLGFGGLMITINADEFGFFMQCLTCLFMFMAGLAAAVASIGSITIVAKNFDSQVSILLVGILITYLKAANFFDNDVGKVLMVPGEDMK